MLSHGWLYTEPIREITTYPKAVPGFRLSELGYCLFSNDILSKSFYNHQCTVETPIKKVFERLNTPVFEPSEGQALRVHGSI